MEYEWSMNGMTMGYTLRYALVIKGGNWTIPNNTGGYIHFLWQVYDENEDKILFMEGF